MRICKFNLWVSFCRYFTAAPQSHITFIFIVILQIISIEKKKKKYSQHSASVTILLQKKSIIFELKKTKKSYKYAKNWLNGQNLATFGKICKKKKYAKKYIPLQNTVSI